MTGRYAFRYGLGGEVIAAAQHFGAPWAVPKNETEPGTPVGSIEVYDWHVNQTIAEQYRGQYSGNLVKDNAIDYIQRRAKLGADAPPFFLYLPFQEAHSPYQAPKKYRDMYPHLASKPESQNLAGMITHTDDMVEDIV